MRSSVLVAILLCVMLIPSSSLADEGRSEPGCLNDTPGAFSSATVIGDGTCIKINDEKMEILFETDALRNSNKRSEVLHMDIEEIGRYDTNWWE